MKYLSYLIILIVLSLVGWVTDNSINTIFATKEKPNVITYTPTAEVTNANFSDSLDIILGN